MTFGTRYRCDRRWHLSGERGRAAFMGNSRGISQGQVIIEIVIRGIDKVSRGGVVSARYCGGATSGGRSNVLSACGLD